MIGKTHQIVVKARLRSRRRGLNEPLVELFYDVKKLTRLAYGSAVVHGNDDPERALQGTAIEYFLDALCNEDMVFLIKLSKPETLEEAYHYAQRYENISLIHPHGGGALFHKAGVADTELNSRSAEIVCNKCGVAGHKVWFCPQISCHGCGAYGHTRRDCAKKNKRK